MSSDLAVKIAVVEQGSTGDLHGAEQRRQGERRVMQT